MSDEILFSARLRWIITESLRRMPAVDRAARIAHCQSTGEHGVRLAVDDDCFRLVWGGRTLALLEEDVFLGEDTYLKGLAALSTSLPDDPDPL